MSNLMDDANLIAALQTAESLLRTNISDIAFVDMENDNYVMTDEEAICSIIIPSNVGDGSKQLSWPPSANGIYPSQQIIVTLYAANQFSIHSSGFLTTTIVPNIVNPVFVSSMLGAINLNQIYAGVYNGERILGAGGSTLLITDIGKTIVANDVNPQTLTIPAGLASGNSRFWVSAESLTGSLTILPGAGVTLVGSLVATLLNGQSGEIQRVGLSNTYRLMFKWE